MADNWSHYDDDDDHFSQVGDLFQLMSSAQQKVLFENTARAMGDASQEIKVRHARNCYQAAPAYGEGIAVALGISLDEISE